MLIFRKGKFGHNRPAEEVFLDDAFQHRWMAAVIPDRFGINHGDGTVGTDAQAACLGAIHEGFGSNEIELFEAFFEVFPGDNGLFTGTAFGFICIRTQEDVAAVSFQAQFLGG